MKAESGNSGSFCQITTQATNLRRGLWPRIIQTEAAGYLDDRHPALQYGGGTATFTWVTFISND